MPQLLLIPFHFIRMQILAQVDQPCGFFVPAMRAGDGGWWCMITYVNGR